MVVLWARDMSVEEEVADGFDDGPVCRLLNFFSDIVKKEPPNLEKSAPRHHHTTTPDAGDSDRPHAARNPTLVIDRYGVPPTALSTSRRSAGLALGGAGRVPPLSRPQRDP